MQILASWTWDNTRLKRRTARASENVDSIQQLERGFETDSFVFEIEVMHAYPGNDTREQNK